MDGVARSGHRRNQLPDQRVQAALKADGANQPARGGKRRGTLTCPSYPRFLPLGISVLAETHSCDPLPGLSMSPSAAVPDPPAASLFEVDRFRDGPRCQLEASIRHCFAVLVHGVEADVANGDCIAAGARAGWCTEEAVESCMATCTSGGAVAAGQFRSPRLALHMCRHAKTQAGPGQALRHASRPAGTDLRGTPPAKSHAANASPSSLA